MDIIKILKHLNDNEIAYRLSSNHCTGYIFYFLDSTIYPRIYHDNELDKSIDFKIISQSAENLIEVAIKTELTKDWLHRIEEENIEDLFRQVEAYIFKL